MDLDLNKFEKALAILNSSINEDFNEGVVAGVLLGCSASKVPEDFLIEVEDYLSSSGWSSCLVQFGSMGYFTQNAATVLQLASVLSNSKTQLEYCRKTQLWPYDQCHKQVAGDYYQHNIELRAYTAQSLIDYITSLPIGSVFDMEQAKAVLKKI